MYQIQADRITFSLDWSAATAVISFSLSNGENTLFHIYQIKGAFLVGHDRVLNGPLGRSKRLFTRTAHSAHSLCSASLWYARLLRSRACSLCSLPHGMVKFLNMYSSCKRVQWEQTRFASSLETRPNHETKFSISSVKNHLRNRKKATLGNLEESVELSLLGNTISNM